MSEPEPPDVSSPPSSDGDRRERAVTEPPPLADALGAVVRRLVYLGRQELTRTAKTGRLRLELRQLQSDRDRFWIRLGKSAYRLVEAGELEHPALAKAMSRIDELELQIEELKGRLSAESAPEEE